MIFKGFCARLSVVISMLVLSVGIASTALAQNTEEHLSEYYGADLWRSMKNKDISDDELRGALLSAISKGHHAVGYDEARRQIFGNLYLQNNGKEYFVKDVYCEEDYTHSKYPGIEFGPNSYPKNGDIINTEHTWPQSRFTNRYPNELQKSDIHHLFPSDSKMNSHRSSLHFGEVNDNVEPLRCPIASLGHDAKTHDIIFEPPKAHKGNVARAILYFATRYEMKVSDDEEAYLRLWNAQDPVDADEIRINNEIEKIQGNRNPFIDVPALIDQIHNF